MSDTFDPDFLDRVLTKANADHDVVELFMQFLLDISTAGSTLEELSTFHIPYSSYTLRILTTILPNAKASALFHDYYFKRVPINNPDGSRKTNDQLYGGDSKMELVECFSKSLFEESDADVIVNPGEIESGGWQGHLRLESTEVTS
ncbi:hypothetical protein LTR15_005107 [Elasticomyces elasticus]|nr:hypothetical protein LTR15_005107 [Elasticomyces elasticus]